MTRTDEQFQSTIAERLGAKPANSSTQTEEEEEGTEGSQPGSGLPPNEHEVDNEPEVQQPQGKQSKQAPAKVTKQEKEPVIPAGIDYDNFSDEDFNKLLDKRTSGKFKAMQELNDYMEKSIIPANERLRAANKWAESENGNELPFYEIHSKDWTKVQDVDLVMEQIRSEYGADIEKEVLDAIAAEKYKLDVDPDSIEFKVGQANLKKDASVLREAKIAEQKTYLESPSSKKAAEAESARQEAIKTYEKRVNDVISDFKGITVEIDGKSFTYSSKDPEQLKTYRNTVKQSLADINGTMAHALGNSERYKGEDGVQKLVEDMYVLNHFDEIMGAYGKAMKDGKMNQFVETNLKGPRKQPRPNPEAHGKAKSPAQAVLEHQKRRGY